MTEVANVLNGLPCILAKTIVINPLDFVTREILERATFGTWNTLQHNFTDTNDLHIKEKMSEILQVTGITSDDL